MAFISKWAWIFICNLILTKINFQFILGPGVRARLEAAFQAKWSDEQEIRADDMERREGSDRPNQNSPDILRKQIWGIGLADDGAKAPLIAFDRIECREMPASRRGCRCRALYLDGVQGPPPPNDQIDLTLRCIAVEAHVPHISPGVQVIISISIRAVI